MSTNDVATQVPAGLSERRKHPRYRYSAPIMVRHADSPEQRGMSVEISECGTSIMIGGFLNVGDKVELEPVGSGTATAIVRRCRGRLYGFEFLDLSPEQTEKIRDMCKMLPAYRSRTLDLWDR